VNAVAASGREWWLRTALVLTAPRAVFVALRQDGEDGAADRAEPVLLIVLLAGVAFVLSTRTAATLMDPTSSDHYDGPLVAVWAFLAGSVFGGTAYWLLGAVLQLSVKALGSQGSYRRSRHLLAFASVPIALSLVLWLLKLALFGSSLFHAGGADSGSGGKVFVALWIAAAAWSAALLVVGVRAVHGWTWARAAAAAVAPLAVAAAIVAA
jgi:hypothetical protein